MKSPNKGRGRVPPGYFSSPNDASSTASGNYFLSLKTCCHYSVGQLLSS